MRRLPPDRRHTLAADNGREFAHHERLSRLLDLDVYFTHPYCSWERGTNENTNGLLCQYLPKAMPLTHLTNGQLGSYVRALNNRPRKCLNYPKSARPLGFTARGPVPGRTPAEVFWHRSVALTM